MGARRWSPAEEAILAEIAKRDLTLISQMHRLPGRTWEAAKNHSSRIGVALRAAEVWSPQEIRTLKKIWRGDESIKSAVARLLPHRGYLAAKGEAQRLGIQGTKKRTGRLGYSWIARACEDALQDGRRLSSAQLAEIVGATPNSVQCALAKARGRTFHIGEWTRMSTYGRFCGLWELGGGPDAERPAGKTIKAANRDAQERRRIRAGNGNPFFSLINQVTA
ncbi:hypothetical protein GCT13_08300 [Paraburkholderia sp. CNPSo 3157]|uniref:Myb-like domain-containing protein n=1 Tax=Paraburkholderia franconis TaxID=2654983 RepID=A0A7X1TF66_9BURK|nr:hypothetical protein [Paraburkholderia franconis]MPW16931.1 hypothetical protein [Paraburkholderia franconis]